MTTDTDTRRDALMALQGIFEGDFTEHSAECIVEALVEDPEVEEELFGQVAVHNLLCWHFAAARSDRGLPAPDGLPQPLEMSVVRVDRRVPAARGRFGRPVARG